jgi:hypothetical protein
MKKNSLTLFILIVISLFGVSTIAMAEAPVLREQLVFSLTVQDTAKASAQLPKKQFI